MDFTENRSEEIAVENHTVWLKWFIYFAFIIGLQELMRSVLFCFSHVCRRKQDLKEKYGRKDNSAWAVVTGGSDGIGLELCN